VGEESVISIEELLGIEPATPAIAATPATPAHAPIVAKGKGDWPTIIKEFAQLESHLPFVGLKLARDKYGFAQDIINEGIALGIFLKHAVSNPDKPYPTTALKLDRNHETVMATLKTKNT
jgi:hypothetical protein